MLLGGGANTLSYSSTSPGLNLHRSIGISHPALCPTEGTVVPKVSLVIASPQVLPLPASKYFNILKPNDIYICRTAALNPRRYILNIYSTNIHTEYFKHAA